MFAKNFKPILIIIVIGLIVYGNMLFNGFVWDDISFILNNADIHTFNITKILGPSLFNSGSYYRPLPALYFSILYSFVQDQAFLYHFIQLGLHIFSSILLLFLLKYFFNKSIALLFALLFLVHPINVESVSYISASASELFAIPGLFILLILGYKKKLSNWSINTIVIFLLLLSLFSKEEGLLFLIMGIIFLLLFRKGEIKPFIFSSITALSIYLFFRVLIGKAASLSIHDFLIRNVQNTGDLKYIPVASLTFNEKLFNIPAIIFYYISTFVFPSKLAVNQIWVINDSTNVFIPLVLDIVIFGILTTFAVYIYHINRSNFKTYLFFFIWFCISLLIHLPIFFPADMTVADRWFYFPIIGLLGMIGVIATVLFPKQNIKTIAFSFLIIIIFIFALRTIVRNTNFFNNMNLYNHDTQYEDNYMMEGELGEEYLAATDFQSALIHLKKANNLYKSERSLYDLGFLNEATGTIDQAEYYYLAAFKVSHNKNNKTHFDTYQRLSYVLIILKNYKEAKKIIVEGLQYYPNKDILWQQLAISEYQLGDQGNALEAIQKAVSINPTDDNKMVYFAILNKKQMSFIKQF